MKPKGRNTFIDRNRGPIQRRLFRDGFFSIEVGLIDGQPLSTEEWQIVRHALGEWPLVDFVATDRNQIGGVKRWGVLSKKGITSDKQRKTLAMQVESFLVQAFGAKVQRVKYLS